MAQLIRLDKPTGTLLLLWPTLAALWWAHSGQPELKLVLIFTLGSFLMRSAGCAINDYADRDLDGHIERTRLRPLPAQTLTPNQALLIAGMLVAMAAGLILLTQPISIILAILGLGLAIVYPFCKRYTNYPQMVLGLAFSWGIPIAWSTAQPDFYLNVPSELVLFFLANWLWILAYDTQYAMSDRAWDLKAGIGSTAIAFGPHERLVIALCLICTWTLWWQAGALLGAGFIYQTGLALIALLFMIQIWIIRNRSPQASLRAFQLNAWAGMIFFLATALELMHAA